MIRPSFRAAKTVGEIQLKLHVFSTEGGGRRRPAIVFFFGGGWVGGNPSQFFPHCEHLAAKGMVAVSAEYRVKSRHQATPFDCVEDARSAVRYLRGHARELGIDPDRIAAGGGSAGGHLAAATGTLNVPASETAELRGALCGCSGTNCQLFRFFEGSNLVNPRAELNPQPASGLCLIRTAL